MSFSAGISAGCKINLRLKVTSVRPDGYHDLDTIFLPLAFPCDRLRVDFAAGESIALECDRFPAEDAEKNLAVKAARLYAEKAQILPEWKISLEKNIPVAAGLGGGSSDAGCVLSLLNEHYRKFSPSELAEIAVSLGADVPFFLERRPVRATGIGEKFSDFVIPRPMPEILLVYPGFPVSAKWAYQNLDAGCIGEGVPISPDDYAAAFAAPETADWDELLRNDLTVTLWKKFPLCRLIKDFILSHGGWAVQFSGSGSSLFAFFGDAGSAADCAAGLRSSQYGNSCTRIFTKDKEW